jgi:hypothetical protein
MLECNPRLQLIVLVINVDPAPSVVGRVLSSFKSNCPKREATKSVELSLKGITSLIAQRIFVKLTLLQLSHLLFCALQCRRRWQNYLNAVVKKGSWSPEVNVDGICACIWSERV